MENGELLHAIDIILRRVLFKFNHEGTSVM